MLLITFLLAGNFRSHFADERDLGNIYFVEYEKKL